MPRRAALRASLLTLVVVVAAAAPASAYRGAVIATNVSGCNGSEWPQTTTTETYYGTRAFDSAGWMLFGFEMTLCPGLHRILTLGVVPELDPGGDGYPRTLIEPRPSGAITHDESQVVLEALGLFRTRNTFTGGIGGGDTWIPMATCEVNEEIDWVLLASGTMVPWSVACPGT